MNDTQQQDQVLQRVLQRASQPVVPAGAEARLMQRVRASSLVARPAQPVAQQRRSPWKGFAWAGIPLAASLALGHSLRQQQRGVENYLPDKVMAWISPTSGQELDVPFTLDDGDLADGSLA